MSRTARTHVLWLLASALLFGSVYTKQVRAQSTALFAHNKAVKPGRPPRTAVTPVTSFASVAAIEPSDAPAAIGVTTTNARGSALPPPQRTLHSLAEARALMLTHEPSLQTQVALLSQARTDVRDALARMLPRLELGLGADYSLVRPAFVSIDRPAEHEFLAERSLIPNLNASFTITFSLANLSLLDSARAGVEAQTSTVAATRHELLGILISTLLGVLGAERVAERNLAGLAAAQERMRLTERLVALGKATALDTLRFTQDLNEAKSGVINANDALSQAREALSRALGLRESVGLADDFAAGDLLAKPAPGCQALPDLEARPELQAAHERVQQAAAAERAADLALLPELRVASQYVANYAPTSAVTFEGKRGLLHTWGATANLVWTLYDGGVRAAASARAEAERRDANAQTSAAAIALASEQREAQRLLTVAQANVEIAQESHDAALKMDQLSQKALELGTASALEVVDAARRLRASEITLAERQVEVIAATVRAQRVLSLCR